MSRVKGPFLTIPNAVTILRGILIVPAIYLWVRGTTAGMSIAIILGVIIIASDIFDGYIARKTGSVTDWGKVLDPLIDKFCILTVVVMAVIYKGFPLYAAIIIVGRDILIVIAGVILFKKRHKPSASHPIGKWAALIIAITLLAYFLDMDSIKEYLLILSLIMVFVSGGFYFFRALKLYREPTKYRDE